MKAIPQRIRREMAADPWYSRCAICGDPRKVEWHHVFIYRGSQIQEKWAIVPACEEHHRMVKTRRRIKEAFERIALNRATDNELRAVSKAINYIRERKRLNDIDDAVPILSPAP